MLDYVEIVYTLNFMEGRGTDKKWSHKAHLAEDTGKHQGSRFCLIEYIVIQYAVLLTYVFVIFVP